MFLTRLSLSRPIVVRMILLLIIIIGIYSYRTMPRYLDPDLTIGRAIIFTLVPGFSPEEMEKLVTNKIEDELRGISKIKYFESKSFESSSQIAVFFQTELSEEEIDKGMQEIRNAVDRVDDLPEEAKPTQILEIEAAIIPACLIGLSGDLPMMQLQDITQDVSEVLEDINEVSEVDIQGEREKEIWVELNPHRLASYGLSIMEVAGAISNRMKNLPGGSIEMGAHETAIRMVGETLSLQDFSGLVLRSRAGGTVYLKDIANIRPTLAKPFVLSYIDKKPTMILNVMRKQNVNIIKLVDQVKVKLSEIEKQYPGLKSTLFFDQSSVIRTRIKELQNNAFLGVIAVFIILWVAIGARNAIYASIGIPVAFLLSFTLMKGFGLSIDGVSLFGLILVLGIVVDDAIVVLENIFRYIERGLPIREAVVTGSREVLAPVLASISTNIAAFFPLLFMISGVIGRFIAVLPQVVIFALCASLFEVFFMLPSHVVEFTSGKSTQKAVAKKGSDVFLPLRRIYYPLLRSILRHRYLSVLFIIAATILAFFLYFQTDFEMFPKSDAWPRFNVHFDLPVGSTLERTESVLMELNDLVKKSVGEDLVAPIASVGYKEINYEPFLAPHFGMMSVILKEADERKNRVLDLMEGSRQEIETLLKKHGATSIVMERLLEGPPVGADLDLKIQSPDWETSARISQLIQEELAGHKGIVDIQDDYSREKQFMEVTVDEARAKALGIDQNQLVLAVQAAFYGLPVATYNQGEGEQDIRLKFLPEYRNDFDDLLNLNITVPGRGMVPLREVAHIQMRPGFHNIFHYNGKQTVRITANIQSKQADSEGNKGFLANLRGERMTAVKANGIAQNYFDQIKADFPGARMIAGGLQEETVTSLNEMKSAAALALFLIFFVLTLQFNSFFQPFIIMITIPFVSLGVIVGLLVSGNPLTFVTLIGLLTLTGIVVNDSLVLIDFINRYRLENPKHLYLAIVRACHVRMRPIMLTSLTTIFGLAPMAFGIGGKSPLWAPLATAIMWGLGFSTVLILSLIPAYYAILEDIGYLLRHRKRRKADTLREIEKAFKDDEIAPYLEKADSHEKRDKYQ